MRTTASRAAPRAPASRFQPLTPPPSPSGSPWCRFARGRSADQGCHFYFARRVTFQPCADSVASATCNQQARQDDRRQASTPRQARQLSRFRQLSGRARAHRPSTPAGTPRKRSRADRLPVLEVSGSNPDQPRAASPTSEPGEADPRYRLESSRTTLSPVSRALPSRKTADRGYRGDHVRAVWFHLGDRQRSAGCLTP